MKSDYCWVTAAYLECESCREKLAKFVNDAIEKKISNKRADACTCRGPSICKDIDRILVDKSTIESLSFHLSEIKRVRSLDRSNALCNKSCDIYTELCNKSAQIYKSVRINNSVNSAIKILEDIKNENNSGE